MLALAVLHHLVITANLPLGSVVEWLAGIGAPVADLVLLQARHADSPEVTPLRFRKPRSAVVQSAANAG